MQGGLVKMSLTAYGDESFGNKLASIDVLVNPDSYKISKNVSHSKNRQQRSSRLGQHFENYGRENLSFSIMLDGTGVLPGTDVNTVKDGVDELDVIIYNFNGNIKRPNFVEIGWGGLLFQGQLDSYTLTYTLFSPGGDPLRVKIDMSFSRTLKIDDNLIQSNKEKLAKLVQAKEGDSAASLSKEKLLDPLFAPLVGKLNALNSLRKSVAGMMLKLPKII